MPDQSNQMAIMTSMHPYQELDVTAIPFGSRSSFDELPIAEKGDASVYRRTLHALRLAQHAHQYLSPEATLFGQKVQGDAIMVSLAYNGVSYAPAVVVEWVTEAGQREWIVRVTVEASVATSHRDGVQGFVNTFNQLNVSGVNLNAPSTLLSAMHNMAAAPRPHATTASEVTMASTLPSPSWWNGNCDVNRNPTAFPLGDAYLGVEACGPRPAFDNCGNYCDYPEHFFSGAWGELEWECVELSMRYLYLAYGTAPYSANGNQVVANYSGSELTKISNGSGQAPQPGDVISFNSSSAVGHTAIVASSNVSNGNGTIHVLQQNFGGNGYGHYNDLMPMTVSGYTLQDENGLHPTGWLHASGTSASTYEIAFEGNNNELFKVGNQPATGTDMLEGMMSGTNPSIAALTSGGHETAFQANNTDLATVGDQPATGVDTHVGMMSGTSPSIAALAGGGYEIAFQANTGHLYVTGTAGTQDLQFGMMYNTSPSIAALTGGGYEIAFESNNGQLWVTGPGGAGAQNLQFGMMGGTNPAIAPLPNNSYEITFQSNNGQLWVTGPGGAGMQNLQFGMMSGTSPAIAELSNGTYEIAFQANTGNLWAVGSNPISGTDMQEGMKAGTNPSIIAFGSSYEIAFEGNTNDLFTVGNQPATGTDMLEGMQTGTSPSIAG